VRRKIWMLALTVALLSTSVLAQETMKDFFYANGKKVAVSVFPDRIGAIGKDRVTQKQVRPFVEEMGLELMQELSGGMFILKLRQPTDRTSILKLAREIRKRGSDLFRDVGFVIQVQG
jgi:UPF0288 family protein (methanogenesis marker protein 3)